MEDESGSSDLFDEDIDPDILRTMSPSEIIGRAAQASAWSAWVRHVAAEVGKDPRYRRSGSTQMFVKHLENAQRRPNALHWYFLAIGIYGALGAIFREKTQVEDAHILTELYRAYWRILEVVVEDLELTDSSEDLVPAAQRRQALIVIILQCFQDPKMFRSLFETKTMSFVLGCWMQTSQDDSDRQAILTVLNNFLGFGKEERHPFLDILLSNTDQMTPVVTRFGWILEQEHLSVSQLIDELQPLLLIANHPTIAQLLAESKFYLQLFHVLQRQSCNNGPDADDLISFIGIILFDIVDSRSSHPDFMATYTTILKNKYVMRAGAAALKVASRADNFDESMGDSVRGWYNLFQGIWHIFLGCGIPIDCPFCKLRRPSAKTFIMRVRKAFERVAFPTLITLRKGSQYRHLWKHLIKFFGITFESTRRRYQLDKKCCSMLCTSRNSGHRSETRRICLGCLTVFYCDRDCQASDWNIHRKECSDFANRRTVVDADTTPGRFDAP
ncbi:hypothetical protein CVT26_012096 [Gymnopilus dilepis]|uniref:MYND-type domain-containing protein n=1 Tax=Gymnopilus dilepis TaxID=231916 RepID=A0A409YGI6_9AGAR|nr:hypothetical protein CVT26_012096 [Gymnopilus dilepis]